MIIIRNYNRIILNTSDIVVKKLKAKLKFPFFAMLRVSLDEGSYFMPASRFNKANCVMAASLLSGPNHRIYLP